MENEEISNSETKNLEEKKISSNVAL